MTSNSASLPRWVRQTAELLSDSVDTYLFTSSLSVHADFSTPGLTETDPVAIIEHTGLYQKAHAVPKGRRDFCIPFGKAHIARSGSTCTVLATSTMVEASVKAANETGVDAEVIDVRNTDYHGIDWELIGASIAKTGRVIIAEESASSMALAGRWADTP